MYSGTDVLSLALKMSWKKKRSTARKPTISAKSKARLMRWILAPPIAGVGCASVRKCSPRRKLVRVTRGLVVVGVFVVVILSLPSGGGAARSPLHFGRAPYVGVSCPAPNVTTCGRVGVAVWLARPGASDVVVSLAGVQARLGPPPKGAPLPSWRTFVRLPLAAMGLPGHWDGQPYKALTLRVRARYGRQWLSRTMVVPLNTGWG